MRYSELSIAWLLAAAVLLLSPMALAARAGNLYAAEVPVLDRTVDERKKSAGAALAQVLVKVSGDRRIGQNSAAAGLLINAEDFMQQHRYTPNRTLLVAFNAGRVQQAMREAGLPVWQEDRPAVMLWLAVDEGDGNQRLINDAERGEIREEIAAVAASRGLPLIWPDAALIARGELEFDDVWEVNRDKLTALAQSGRAEGVLVGKLSRGGSGNLYGSWQLLAGGEDQWRSGLGSSIHRTTDFFAQRLASSAAAGGATSLLVQISGLSNGGAYADAISSLEKLGVVERVHVLEAINDSVVVNLNLKGSADQFARAVSFNRVLRPVSGSGVDGSILQYTYTP